ncbi:hypothetical protein AS359_04220 [Comamonas kerstersii]|uniref:Photosynthesis system II assembly factor Ycf48/Hcf136-like domain-containing protein n=1 Tax=Comamonas kerstersii TaxID=225992 RepID=A0A0W7YS58_9BURK|nr:hypothetical protein [Comamonas kerstersii]KUF37927.1 hypothetical protein AS359_04220 [Comamonas kerstersii]
MLSTSWSICGIDTDGHDLTLSRLVAWGEAGELVPASVVSTLPPIAGAIDNLLVDGATTVTFAAADVRQPGFLITFEFAEPVELWGWRMAALTRAGWPRMHAVKAGEHVQFLGQLEWQGIGVLSAPSYSPVNFAQACGAFVSLPAAGSRSWRGVATHDGVTVYAVESGGVIYKSTDGGATWAALSSGGRYWYGVATHDGVTVYAVVHGGVIYKSTDGGATWVALSSGSRSWYGVATHDGVTVYAVEYGGVIYKSTDGGATWVALSSGSRSWYGVATHDGVTVYAVVSGGVIYKSADGGATWVALSSGSRYWHGVATHDGLTLYAVVSGGVIYKSADGGATWAALSSAASRSWHGVATHDGVTVYAVEYGGVIYKNIQLPSIYNIDLRALTTSTPVTAGNPPLEDATLAVEPVYTTIDLDVGGCGRIYGTVKRKADPQNIPLVRRVRLHDSRTGALLRQTWSQEDGSYEFRDLNPDLEFDVIAWDHEGQFRSTIANNLKPEVLP